MRSRSLRVVSAIALLSCLIVGCGGGDFDRVPVAGTVTLDGANVSGSILATPAELDAEAPNVSTAVDDGKFSFSADQAPVAGSYVFEIAVAAEGATDVAGPDGDVETETAATYRKTVDIPAGGSESLSIELTAADIVAEDSL